MEQVTDAVSALTRTTLGQLQRRGSARSLLLQSLKVCTPLSARRIGRELGMSHSSIVSAARIPEGALRCVERVLGDQRFAALQDCDLAESWEWCRYRESRERRGAYDALLRAAAPQLRRRSMARLPQIGARSNKKGLETTGSATKRG